MKNKDKNNDVQKETHKPTKKEKKKVIKSIVFKSVISIVVLLTLFSVVISMIGYNGFTNALLDQYSEDAHFIAKIAASACVDTTRMDNYAKSEGKTKEYLDAWYKMDKLCNSSGVTFIYVIRPDLKDYKHITFLFSTINEKSNYKCYNFGFVRDTTNDEYREKYKKLYDGLSEHEVVIRDQGYIETDPHITAMIPLKDENGKTTAILCVQRQMEDLVKVRNNYLFKVIGVLIITAILVIILQSIYLNIVFLKPVRKITKETSRFAKENKLAKQTLSKKIKNKDEIGELAASIDTMEEKIVNYVDDLTKITAEKERITTELALATKIQASMLPNIFPPFPDRTEFDIFASMDPAKEVGGDFYDFFLVDDDHLCIVMADVSGKGVPAALFMMSTKIIISNYAKMGKSPSEILSTANKAICSRNQEDMFVTVWLGILEVSTGKLTASNAGHEFPVLKQGDKFELFKDKHGFVLGGMDGMKYKEYEIELTPGSKLFLYTDGVPEATNSENELFGTERMIEALNIKPDTEPKEILQNVRSSVDSFVKDAEQFDDLTMLCMVYKGSENKK